MLGCGGLSAKIPPQRSLSVPSYYSHHVGLARTGLSAQAVAQEIKHILCYQTEQQHIGASDVSTAAMSDSSDEEGGGRGYPLHDAVEAGDLTAIRAMLQAPSARGSAAAGAGDGSAEEPSNGHSMFEDADEEDDEYDPFSASIDINERDHEGCTPLHVALLYRQLGALSLLLEHRAAVARNLEGSTPAHIALSVGA
eukprot:15960-Heterococcus_DN1.PRE.2